MKTLLKTHHDAFPNSELNEFLGFTKKEYPAGTFSRENLQI